MFRFADDCNRIRMIVNGLQLRKTDDFRTTPFRLKRKRPLAETVACTVKPKPLSLGTKIINNENLSAN
ncbi:hypothetical protein [Anaerorudis cellulosivorans]|uniref:hypothetical protein n=1 Tax=Anaerorudis cellulosivorans TaxID=3397862 RepID=UPI002220BB48|nr:hypothetical protein [Seramator thermalis]MCW1734097.1 hypothetical protein [Seramator thermalis]